MKIEDAVSYCGLSCAGCLIYCASKVEDKAVQIKLRTRIAQISNEQYGTNYTFEDIKNCDGCRSECGSLFLSSLNCEVRKCARESGCKSCSYCPNYACAKLQEIFSSDPSAKTWLEVIRSVL
ncbi:MAG TPA: DUF3795 domain-containing protein [Ignavibacteriaceae bacterium]|nr:DUF3795 domain-containing protein [Ignavibacteriaceae bacterium]